MSEQGNGPDGSSNDNKRVNNVLLFRKRTPEDGDLTLGDLPASLILEEAMRANLKGVVIMGYVDDGANDGEGSEYLASSIASGPIVNWLCDRVKHVLQSAMGDEQYAPD